MRKFSLLGALSVVGLVLPWSAQVFGQDHISDVGISSSANAADNRNWALKGGPGAPHNILPGPQDARLSEESMFLRMPKLTSDYTLGSGDRIDVEFVGGDVLGGATTGLTVSNAGSITLPYVGDIRVAGLTAAEVEESITQRFKEKDLLKNPEVLVFITDYKANPIFIMGEVDNPGEYMMSQELTLMEAILMAGGIDPGAGTVGYLHRQTPAATVNLEPSSVAEHPTVAQPGVEVIEIDLSPLKTGAVPKPDMLLRKGDILVIPKANDRRFYVLGDVKQAGTVLIPQPAERVVLASQAIAFAGGPNPTAKMSEGMLVRYNKVDGSREEIHVDYMAILKGKEPDFEVLPNDIIFIPSSNAKTMAYQMLGQLPQTLTQRATNSIRTN